MYSKRDYNFINHFRVHDLINAILDSATIGCFLNDR